MTSWRPGDDPGELTKRLEQGAIAAFPSESSYALGVNPLEPDAVRRLFELKGRPEDKALPVIAASVNDLYTVGVLADTPALRWARARWPAALTVVLPLARPIAASGGRAELAVRIPEAPHLRQLLAIVGRPLTATSANPSGSAPYLASGRVLAWLEAAGAEAVVIGEGDSPGGPPSTLVALEGGVPRVIRPGRVAIA